MTRSEIGQWWDWWLDCPLWKPFVDYCRECPRCGDPVDLPRSELLKRSPLLGMVVLLIVCILVLALSWGIAAMLIVWLYR